MKSVGIAQGGRPARELAASLRTQLNALPGFRVLDRGAELAALVTVAVEGWDAPDLVNALRQRGINTSASLREYAVIDMNEKHAASALRISPHYYNTEVELETILDALRSLTAKAGAN